MYTSSHGVSADPATNPFRSLISLQMLAFRFSSLLVLEVYLVACLVQARPAPAMLARQGGTLYADVDVTVYTTAMPETTARTSASSATTETTTSRLVPTSTDTHSTATTDENTVESTAGVTGGLTAEVSATLSTDSITESSITTTSSELPSTTTDDSTPKTENDKVPTASEIVSTVTATSIFSEAGSMVTSASIQIVTVEKVASPVAPATVVAPPQFASQAGSNPIAPRPTTMPSARPATTSVSRLGSATTGAVTSAETATAIALIPVTTNSDGKASPATKTQSLSQIKPPELADRLQKAISRSCQSTCSSFIDLVDQCNGPDVMELFPSANEGDAKERCLCAQPEPIRECTECMSGIKEASFYGSFINRCRVDGLLVIEETQVSLVPSFAARCLVDFSRLQSMTVTDEPKSTSTVASETSETSKTSSATSAVESSSKKSSSGTFGPEEICDVDGQSTTNKPGERCFLHNGDVDVDADVHIDTF